MRRHGLIVATSLLTACLGEPIVAGDTLGDGTDAGGSAGDSDGDSDSGPDSGNANFDPDPDTGTAEPDCYEYDDDALQAHAALLVAMDAQISQVQTRLNAATATIRATFDTPDDAPSAAAVIRALFAANTDGPVAVEQGPIVCEGGLAAAMTSATTCAPDEAFEIECSNGAVRCGDCSEPMLRPQPQTSCEASCFGTCDLGGGSGTCEGVCDGVCQGACNDFGEDGECFGDCGGICDGQCLNLGGQSCEGECDGQCVGGSVDDGWCPETGTTAACLDTMTDCDGRLIASGLRNPCAEVVTATGAAAGVCKAPELAYRFSFRAESDAASRVEFWETILPAAPAIADLRALAAQIDRVPPFLIPPCSDPDGYSDRYSQLFALREQALLWASALEE